MLDLSTYSVPIVSGINDVSIPPNYNNNGRGCNGAYLLAQYNALIQALEDYLNSLEIPTSMSVSGDLTGTYPHLELVSSGVTAGVYPNATITVDAKGRVTDASKSTYDIPGSISTPTASVYYLLQPSSPRELSQFRITSGAGTATGTLLLDGTPVAGAAGFVISPATTYIVPSTTVTLNSTSRLTLSISSPNLIFTSVDYTITLR